MNYDKIKQIFASSDERLVAILGNNVAQTFFANGRIKEGFAILSNRRLYFKGTCLLRQETASPKFMRNAPSMSKTSPEPDLCTVTRSG